MSSGRMNVALIIFTAVRDSAEPNGFLYLPPQLVARAHNNYVTAYAAALQQCSLKHGIKSGLKMHVLSLFW